MGGEGGGPHGCAARQLPDGDDIVARVFGSDDFHRAVGAFMAKEKVVWTGR